VGKITLFQLVVFETKRRMLSIGRSLRKRDFRWKTSSRITALPPMTKRRSPRRLRRGEKTVGDLKGGREWMMLMASRFLEKNSTSTPTPLDLDSLSEKPFHSKKPSSRGPASSEEEAEDFAAGCCRGPEEQQRRRKRKRKHEGDGGAAASSVFDFWRRRRRSSSKNDDNSKGSDDGSSSSSASVQQSHTLCKQPFPAAAAEVRVERNKKERERGETFSPSSLLASRKLFFFLPPLSQKNFNDNNEPKTGGQTS
jgi:hypothetical protein